MRDENQNMRAVSLLNVPVKKVRDRLLLLFVRKGRWTIYLCNNFYTIILYFSTLLLVRILFHVWVIFFSTLMTGTCFLENNLPTNYVLLEIAHAHHERSFNKYIMKI